MGVNHVRMEGQILDELRQLFQPLTCTVRRSYGNLWQYLLFIGK
jgi:S-adenosylmethionine-diacylgycerolhomoserine-N-methlytransferase